MATVFQDEDSSGFHQEVGSAGPIVRLVQFPPVWGRNVSPFTLKLETWLRLASIPFEIRFSRQLHKAPKGKLPYIQDGPLVIGDSTLIIEHLKRTRGIDPDATLTSRERAESVALQRLFEDHLYFAMVYSRWIDRDGWPVVADGFLHDIPTGVRGIVGRLLRERMRRMLRAQGMGRHKRHEVYELARADLEAASSLLGDRPFFMGDRLTSIDAVAYGFLANILLVPVETQLKEIAQGYPNLVTFCDSMEQGLYGDAEW
jgi:glutathione S-transferase